MSSTEDVTEYYDAAAQVREKATLVAQLLKRGDAVFFTGAGISTSASIPDYRGPKGVWTLQEKGETAEKGISLELAEPTLAHKVIARLVENGIARGVVSTNVDGLHLKSGVSSDKLAELHGNCFVEYCNSCKTSFTRSFNVGCKPGHLTGRKCDKCSTGELRDNVIHFGEPLLASTFAKAENLSAGKTAIVLGTSLRVKPASTLPLKCKDMVIVNLQKTPHDETSKVVVRAEIDLFMHLVAKEMGIEAEYSPRDANWETLYDERAAQTQRKEREHSRKVLAEMTSSVVSSFKAPKRGEIVGEVDQTRDVDEMGPLLIRDCRNCTFVLKKKVLKLVLLDCTKTNVLIDKGIITGTLEVINSSRCTLAVHCPVPTIQVDNSPKLRIGFGNPEYLGSIVSAANSAPMSVSVSQAKSPRALIFPGLEKLQESEFLRAMTQFITRVRDSGELYTEVVVREGNGYATTQREKEAADAKDARNKVILEKFLRQMVNGK